MPNIAIIPARSGSKRIPQKNIKDFYGKPIIAYSIDAAIKSKVFDEVMVSTDSDEIAEVAKQYGAKVPFIRSNETSNDYATTADVLLEVLERYNEIGKTFEFFCCVYPTAPFITSEKLKLAYKKFVESKADSLVPVVRFSFPPQRAFEINKGLLAYQYPEWATSRSQDLEPLYHDCGQFYYCRTETFLRNRSLVCSCSIPLEMEEAEVQDIDNESDWMLAELKFQVMQMKQRT